MGSEIQETIRQVELAQNVVLKLQAILGASPEAPADAEERRWLAVAESRLAQDVVATRSQLEGALGLPELKALRGDRQQQLEQKWLHAARELFGTLAQEVGEGSPLVEALFPHQRFEKLERGGNALRAYRAEFTTRRASTYVRRLATDPEYPSLAALLRPVDEASDALAAWDASIEPSEEEALTLRSAILRTKEALGRRMQQARALSEAALIEQPELFAELVFEERGRKRAPRPQAEQLAPAPDSAAEHGANSI